MTSGYQAWGATWINDHAAVQKSVNKPVIIEEYGVTTSDRCKRFIFWQLTLTPPQLLCMLLGGAPSKRLALLGINTGKLRRRLAAVDTMMDMVFRESLSVVDDHVLTMM